MAACTWRAWAWARGEAREPMRTDGCLDTGKPLPRLHRAASLQEPWADGKETSLSQTLTLLGIETSCDETAAAVVRRGADGTVQVLSSVIATQFARHAPFGGVVPEIAARAHVEVIDPVIA